MAEPTIEATSATMATASFASQCVMYARRAGTSVRITAVNNSASAGRTRLNTASSVYKDSLEVLGKVRGPLLLAPTVEPERYPATSRRNSS